jgi:hypothetical protein
MKLAHSGSLAQQKRPLSIHMYGFRPFCLKGTVPPDYNTVEGTENAS